MDRLLTAKQVGELLNVNQFTIYQWVREGSLPAIREGRTLRFSPAGLEAWARARSATEWTHDTAR
jgi:excisionase family DNA binding protein